MTDAQTHFTAHLYMASVSISVVVHLSKSELSIWGLYESVPWMKIPDFITKGTATQNQTTDGQQVIVNWSNVQFVTYDNPWADIPRERAIKFT